MEKYTLSLDKFNENITTESISGIIDYAKEFVTLDPSVSGFIKGAAAAYVLTLLADIYSKREIIFLNTRYNKIENLVKSIGVLGFKKEVNDILYTVEFERMNCENEVKRQTETSDKIIQIHVCLLSSLNTLLVRSLDIYVNLLKSQGVMSVSVKNGFYDIVSVNTQLNTQFTDILKQIYIIYLSILDIIYKDKRIEKTKVINKINNDLKERFNGDKLKTVGTKVTTIDKPVFNKTDFKPTYRRMGNNESTNTKPNTFSQNKNQYQRRDDKPNQQRQDQFKRGNRTWG